MSAKEHLSEAVLAEAVEGRLSPWRQRRVLRHLAACSACAREWAALHDLLQQTRQLEPTPLHHPLERVLSWLDLIVPSSHWAWHILLFALTPLAWFALVDVSVVPYLDSYRTLRVWPAALLMTTHFLWLQGQLRRLMVGLWQAGVPAGEVERFQRLYLAPLQGWGWGGGWLFLGFALLGTAINWQLMPSAATKENLKAAAIGFYALTATSAMYWGWLWGGRLWRQLGQLVERHPHLKEEALLSWARRLAGGWVAVAGGCMLWHLLLSFNAPDVQPAAQVWSTVISLVLISLWSGYARLEWRLAQRPIAQRRNWQPALRLATTLALVGFGLPLPWLAR